MIHHKYSEHTKDNFSSSMKQQRGLAEPRCQRQRVDGDAAPRACAHVRTRHAPGSRGAVVSTPHSSSSKGGQRSRAQASEHHHHPATGADIMGDLANPDPLRALAFGTTGWREGMAAGHHRFNGPCSNYQRGWAPVTTPIPAAAEPWSQTPWVRVRGDGAENSSTTNLWLGTQGPRPRPRRLEGRPSARLSPSPPGLKSPVLGDTVHCAPLWEAAGLGSARKRSSSICALDTEKVDDPVRFDMNETNRTGITTLQVPKVSMGSKACLGRRMSSRQGPGDESDAEH